MRLIAGKNKPPVVETGGEQLPGRLNTSPTRGLNFIKRISFSRQAVADDEAIFITAVPALDTSGWRGLSYFGVNDAQPCAVPASADFASSRRQPIRKTLNFNVFGACEFSRFYFPASELKKCTLDASQAEAVNADSNRVSAAVWGSGSNDNHIALSFSNRVSRRASGSSPLTPTASSIRPGCSTKNRLQNRSKSRSATMRSGAFYLPVRVRTAANLILRGGLVRWQTQPLVCPGGQPQPKASGLPQDDLPPVQTQETREEGRNGAANGCGGVNFSAPHPNFAVWVLGSLGLWVFPS